MDIEFTSRLVSALLSAVYGLGMMKILFWLAIAVAALGLFLWYRARLRHQAELWHLRRQIATELHDEVGSWLTRISLNAELIQNGYFPDRGRQQKALDEIFTATRMANNSMRDIIWMMDTQHEETSHLLDRMHDHAEGLLSPRATDFHFRFEKEQLVHRLPMLVKQNLLLIYKEAIHNIAKHSNASKVIIDLGNRDGIFTMRISDNGTQVAKEKLNQLHTKAGMGLRSMSNRAQRIGGKLSISTERGFSVELNLKLAQMAGAMAN